MIKVQIDGETVEAKVVENLGFVHGVGTRAKVVSYKGSEYVVIKDGQVWRTRQAFEKIGPRSYATGQNAGEAKRHE